MDIPKAGKNLATNAALLPKLYDVVKNVIADLK